MNKLRRTLALVSVLALSATAFVGCGKNTEEETPATPEATTAPAVDVAPDGETPDIETPATPAGKSEVVGAVDPSLGTDGDVFTVVSWNGDDANPMLKMYNDLKGDLKEGKLTELGGGGGAAPPKYDALFKSGDDVDVYFVEADWALGFIGNDERTVPLDKLGFTDANFADMYSYTDDIGKDVDGVRYGASWQAAAGGFAYRSDLAEDYLGVKSPEEMQAQISDWAKFEAAAKTISEKTDKKVSLADSLGGIWQAFAAGRTTPWVEEGALQIDDSCKQYADLVKSLWDVNGVAKFGQWNDDWTSAGATGKTMGYFVSTWGFGGFFQTATGTKEGEGTFGKWQITQGPTPYFWGGTWIVVHPTVDNANEAQKFIKTFTVDNATMKEYANSKPEYVNNKVVMDEVVAAGGSKNEVINGNLQGQNYYAVLHETAKQIDFKGLITPYDATIKGAFNDAVENQYLKGGKTWEETIKAFKDKVKTELPSIIVE